MKKLRAVILIILTMLIASCSVVINDSTDNSNKDSNNLPESKDSTSYHGKLKVSIVDVGQGDAIVIKTPNDKYVLIDSGSSKESDKFFNYLSKQKIKGFSAVVGTHPHEDHIGNMDKVILNYNVQNIYLPKVTASTKTFQNLMDALKNKNMKVKTAKAGVKFNIDGVSFEFLAPNSDKYEDLNNYSAALRVTYNNDSFIFMGDAEKLSEKEILKNNTDISSQVIKIGHHGSSSSSSKEFLKKINPKYAVISCGEGNDYGHPHKETIKLLNDMNIKAYRTDLNGTVTFESDGNKKTAAVEKSR